MSALFYSMNKNSTTITGKLFLPNALLEKVRFFFVIQKSGFVTTPNDRAVGLLGGQACLPPNVVAPTSICLWQH